MAGTFPPIDRETRISPMPKSICAAGGRLRSLAAAAKGSVLTARGNSPENR